MDNGPAGALQLPQELESWTRELITHVTGNLRGAAAEQRAGHLLNPRIGVVRALVSAVRRLSSSRLQLHCLPARALELICQHLALTERIALSHASRDIRDRLLSIPGIWSDMDTSYLRSPYITADILRSLAARSADKRLLLVITLYDRNILSSLPIVALNLHRISSLSLSVNTEQDVREPSTSDSTFWKAALDALLAPAPHLERLSLSVSRRYPWIVLHTFYGDLKDPVPLSSTLLAGRAPLLRTLQLSGVRLCTVGSCAAFRNIACFNFSRTGTLDVEEVAHAISLMPQLHTLGLQAFGIRDALPGSRSEYPLSSSLRNLMLRVEYLSPESLCRIIKFRQLRFLDIYPFEAIELISVAYPALCIKTLVMADIGNALTLEDDSGNPLTTIRIYPRIDLLIDTWSAVTWLAVHEFHWPGNGEWDVPPALPAVEALRICLATCDESLQASDPISVLARNAPGFAWHLAGLRQLCITAPSACTAGATHCACLGSRSVALSDVARFVRLGMDFDAPRLDEVRLAGLRIIDPDFCVAWEEMSAYATTIELVEQPEPIPHMDLTFALDYDIETFFQNREL